jgi:hypothetical protein
LAFVAEFRGFLVINMNFIYPFETGSTYTFGWTSGAGGTADIWTNMTNLNFEEMPN